MTSHADVAGLPAQAGIHDVAAAESTSGCLRTNVSSR